MAKKAKPKVVQCHYPKCSKLHESTSLPKEEAIQGGKQHNYYHPDCYHIMQTVCKIRDTFYKEVNPELTSKQIGQLVSIVNHMVLEKKIDVDFIFFSLLFFIKNKPGRLQFPAGITYIVQDRDVIKAWEEEQQKKLKREIEEQQKEFVPNEESIMDMPEVSAIKNFGKKKISSVLGV